MKAASSAPSGASQDDDALPELRAKWRDAGNLPARRLLRLSVLRDLYRDVHARISSESAAGDALALRILQPRIEALRDAGALPEEWEELFRASTEPESPPEEQVLAEPLVRAFGRERILRYDRKWEAALAAEAQRQGWSLWTAVKEVRLSEVGAVNDRLVRELWPRGICLFCEPASIATPTVAPADERATPPGFWRGRWWLAHAPDRGPPLRSSPPLPSRR